MKLGKLFRNLRGHQDSKGKQKPTAPARTPKTESSAEASRGAEDDASAHEASSQADHVETGSAADTEMTRENAADMFGAIQSVLESDVEGEADLSMVEVPCAAVLRNLPEELRGPNWDAAAMPNDTIPLKSEEILEKLKQGRVEYAVSDLRPLLPPGWVDSSGEGSVELDLPQVVTAISPELLQGASEVSDGVRELTDAEELFTPVRTPAGAAVSTEGPVAFDEEPPVTPPVEAAPPVEREKEPEPVAAEQPPPSELPAPPPADSVAPAVVPEAEPAPVLRARYKPVDWDGTEVSQLGAAGGVDVNTAAPEHLEVLPGVGPARAGDIVAFREKNGRFHNIYELSAVPGIGARSFRLMTGLALTTGRDRHEDLNKLLGLPAKDVPSLATVLSMLVDQTNASGAVLSGDDGVSVAAMGLPPGQTENIAAMGSQLFRRTGRYLNAITDGEVDCMSLPSAKPSLLLFAVNGIYLTVVSNSKPCSQKAFKKAYAVARELGWLLGKRAIVRAFE
ncbi:MAG: helix-hairpin-helix domain-containing protein [Candidatus Pacebacteria bacterium]|nr:helix-hairpin-helix domain-containing protein [Candidatus Paceibacterota bacterium]